MDIIFLQAQGGGGFGMVVPFALAFLVMYLFILRPQMKKNKKQEAYREEIKKGDKIVTSGGIHGKISEIRDQVFIIDTEGGGKLKINKSAVSMEATAMATGKTTEKTKK
ncbi:MAG: preprotein translocase subunit YajC [Bacteroidia bacterium]|nr:preprotein translocase subunit YajC [Bacteroidia bacterium]